jgi:hypothetical protein
MPPEEISKDPKNKQSGQSSKHLKLSDFELMRTLGTRSGDCLLGFVN